MSNSTQQNILIGYTKWLLKWIVIISICLAVMGGIFWSYNEYQRQLIPMVAIKCESVLSEGAEVPNEDTPRYYLIQRRRNKQIPYALYRPASYLSNVTENTKYDDLWEQYSLQTIHPEVYVFGNYDWKRNKNTKFHTIQRDNFQVTYNLITDGKQEQIRGKDCNEITTEEFFTVSEQLLSKRQSKIKF